MFNKIKRDLIITICIIMLSFCCGCGRNAVNTPVEPVLLPISEEEMENNTIGDSTDKNKTSSEIASEESSERSVDNNPEATEDEVAVSIIMVGDMLLHDRIEEVSKKADNTYEYGAIFDNTRDLISEADIAIVNEEVIIGGSELGVSGYPAFNAPFEFADTLADTGFDVVCHATNHALDKGGKGIKNCLANWESKYPDMTVLGIHDSEVDQNEVSIIDINGIRVAILNYTYGTNGISLPANMPYAVDYINQEKIIQDLEYAEANADFTIVCPHWGTEYSLSPDSYQDKWAKIFAENGADLIIGTHPHVIEKIDWISHDDGNGETLCYYSLGNFVNWTSGTGQGVANRMVGAIASIEIKRTGEDKVEISNYDAIPVVSHVTSKDNGVTVYLLSDYTDELAVENEIISQAPDFDLNYCKELVGKILGDEFQ